MISPECLVSPLMLAILTPDLSPRHGTIMETVGSLLSLIRTGDRDAYRQFLMDAMLLSEEFVKPLLKAVLERLIRNGMSKCGAKCSEIVPQHVLQRYLRVPWNYQG